METNQIYLMDAVEFLRGLPSASADLIICDPPYSIPKDFGGTFKYEGRSKWLAWSEQWLSEAARLLAAEGNLAVYSLHQSAAFLHVYLDSIGLVYRRQLIWYYRNGFSNYRSAPACNYEVILWFAKSPRSTFNPTREPYQSKERLRYRITKNGKDWSPHPDGRLMGDVWEIPTLAGRRFANERVEHPTQKPLALSERLVSQLSNPDGLVVVPFVGSGSECLAAARLGRRFLGSEMNPAYVALAQERLSNYEPHMLA